jgi:hypothetical protein
MIKWKGFGRSGRGLILSHYPGIRLEGLGKITKNLNQDSRSPGRDLNPGPPEYESGVLTTRWRRSVRPKRRWQDNVKMDLRQTWCESVKLIQLPRDTVQWQIFCTRWWIYGFQESKKFLGQLSNYTLYTIYTNYCDMSSLWRHFYSNVIVHVV